MFDLLTSIYICETTRFFLFLRRCNFCVRCRLNRRNKLDPKRIAEPEAVTSAEEQGQILRLNPHACNINTNLTLTDQEVIDLDEQPILGPRPRLPENPVPSKRQKVDNQPRVYKKKHAGAQTEMQGLAVVSDGEDGGWIWPEEGDLNPSERV